MKKLFLMVMAAGLLAGCTTKDAKQEALSQV